MAPTPPIRSLATEEGDFEIPRWGVPLVLVLLYVCLFSGLGVLGLVGPDEPRYAAIARAMAETHDWITPRLWGTPWFEKPVLYYWTAGIAMRILGVSEFAARLPSALAALLAVAAAAWTALRSYGVSTAWYVLLMLPTSVAMIGFSRAAGPDTLFAGLLTAAMAIAVEMLQTARPGPVQRVAFGFFLGAAVLAKGPAAVILAGGATLLWAALTKQWKAPFRFLHPVGMVMFCVTALPWYVMCALRNPDFLRVFLWQHNFERYTTPIFEHTQPFWYYAPILLLAVVPWILFLLAGLAGAALRLKSKGKPESIDIFLACWALFPIIFFSFSQSKLPGYILPAIPPLFILLARWVSESTASNLKMMLHMIGWTGVFLLAASEWGATFVGRTHELFSTHHEQAGFIVFPLGVAIVFFAVKKKLVAAIVLIAVLIVSTVEFANFAVLPRLDSLISARPMAKKLIQSGASGDNTAIYKLPRTSRYELDFYMNRELPEWLPGNSEPEWILASARPDRQFLARYTIEPNEGLADAPFIVVYHRSH